ncbi:MAG: thioredoxin domain-containing protein [Patescibacteria group bacterium]
METEPQKTQLSLPMAIVLAGIIIGGAVFFSRGGGQMADTSLLPSSVVADSEPQEINIRKIDSSDHLLGNPNARITMVEFSDLECPFCKDYDVKLNLLMDQYGKNGDLAWVYRHFPLDIHPKSPKESEAAECAFDQGGDPAFWDFVTRVFKVTPSNNGLDPAQLPKIAGDMKLDVAKFNACLANGDNADVVKKDFEDGLNANVNGTPNTVFVLSTPLIASSEAKLLEINQTFLRQSPPGTPNILVIDKTKTKIQISGDLNMAALKQFIDLALKKS